MKHNHKLLALLSLAPLTFGACQAMDTEADLVGSAEQELNNNPLTEQRPVEYPRGSKMVMDPIYEQELVESGAIGGPIAHAGETIVYMNRVGGTFSPGNNDATSNRTTLAPQTVNFPPANLSDGTWNEVMSCVKQQFSQFNIVVTDQDPGNVPHYESVVAGSPGLLGMPNGVGGVSPFTSNCDVIPNSIVFTFTDVLPNNAQIICEVAAQEIAHSFGLDHEFLCEDPMTYLNGCGAKSFQNVAAPCGEDSARPCAQPGQYDCGYQQQNSVQLMTQRIGLNPNGPGGFDAAISAPLDGQTVNQGFQVSVDADSASSVELRIDGITEATLTSGPFLFRTPSDLSTGTHVLEIVATSGNSTTTDSIAVNVVDDGSGEGGGNGDGSGGGNGDGSGGGDGFGNGGTPQVVGGCSTTGGGAGDTGMLVLLALAVLVLRRRFA